MHVKNNKNDICLFQETQKTGNGGIDFEDPVLKGWRVIYSGFKMKAQTGAEIVCAPHVTVEDEIFLIRKGVLSELVSVLMELSCQFFLVTALQTLKFTLIRLKMHFTVPFQNPLKILS